jgi:hypothetical protein
MEVLQEVLMAALEMNLVTDMALVVVLQEVDPVVLAFQLLVTLVEMEEYTEALAVVVFLLLVHPEEEMDHRVLL